MAHHKSALKRIRLSARQTIVNRNRRNRIRTFVKQVELAIAGGDKDVAGQALKLAQPEMMRGVSRGAQNLAPHRAHQSDVTMRPRAVLRRVTIEAASIRARLFCYL